MNEQKPRIGTYPWSQLGRVGIWNNNYDEFGNAEDWNTTGQWEVIHGHKFVKSFDSYSDATSYVHRRLTA